MKRIPHHKSCAGIQKTAIHLIECINAQPTITYVMPCLIKLWIYIIIEHRYCLVMRLCIRPSDGVSGAYISKIFQDNFPILCIHMMYCGHSVYIKWLDLLYGKISFSTICHNHDGKKWPKIQVYSVSRAYHTPKQFKRTQLIFVHQSSSLL